MSFHVIKPNFPKSNFSSILLASYKSFWPDIKGKLILFHSDTFYHCQLYIVDFAIAFDILIVRFPHNFYEWADSYYAQILF